ncbi:MAG: alpha/beta fold hydrolase [Gammaproteobacteria bacterium]|nr:alpha/beta fold hydrolase [Gammaproteobacteria bacterium]
MILAHGFGGTADAGLDPYARMFAESGMHAIIFDYRHFGSSEGEPPQLVSIRHQLQDWHAAVAFARSQEGIDAERIVLWGMSLSGGHVIHVAARDRRISAIIAQFPMLDGLAALRNILGYAGYGQILKLMSAGIREFS